MMNDGKQQTEHTEVILDKEFITKIHPAIDYANDTCYIGLNLPVKLVTDNKGVQSIKKTEHLCLLTSKKELFVATEGELKKRNLILRTTEVFMTPRFSSEGIKSFLGEELRVRSFQDIYKNVKERYEKFVEFPHKNWYVFASCLTMATYFFKIFNTYPIWWLWGLKRTGKTKTGDLFSLLAFNGMKSGLFSSSGLFRATNDYSCSIVYDESEELGKSKERQVDIVAIINSGYKKGSPVIKSIDTPKGFKSNEFDVYGPKVLCNIHGVSVDTLKDRTIKTIMQRSMNSEIVNSELEFTDPIFQNLRDDLYILALQFWPYVKRKNENLKDYGIMARERELWRPVLVMAEIISENDRKVLDLDDFTKWIKEEVIAEKEREEESEDTDSLILKAIEENIQEGYSGIMTTKEINESTKNQFGPGEVPPWVNSRSIGWRLRRLGFKPDRRKMRERGWEIPIELLIDVCGRVKVEIDNKRLSNVKTSQTSQTSLEAPK